MGLKKNGQDCIIAEQTIKDELTGLTLVFVKYDHPKLKGCRLTILGDCLPHGNRDIVFDSNGEVSGRGTNLLYNETIPAGEAPTE